MPLSIGNKIILFILIIFLCGTITSKNLGDINLFQIKKITIQNKNTIDDKIILGKLAKYKFKNILFIKKNEIENLIFEDSSIESIKILKKYPSELNIKIDKTKILANINIQNKNYYIGSNKKLIDSSFIDIDLPVVIGEPSIKEFFEIRELIINSNLKFNNIMKLYFFPSKRWDLEFTNGNILKLPTLNSNVALKRYETFYKINNFSNKKIFDMRANNQLIVNEL